MIIRGDISKRIFPLVLSNCYEIYDALKRPLLINEIETYWKNKEQELLDAINFNNTLHHSKISIRNDLNFLNQIISIVSDFISHIGNSKRFNFDDELKTKFKAFVEYIIKETKVNPEQTYYQKIEGDYFGREHDIKFIDEFLIDESKQFLLLYGVGGMGKSHLLSVCLNKFNYQRKFFWAKADKNFELKDLFKSCNLRFPKELTDTKEICKLFLDEFTSNNLFLIVDDWYEIIDSDVRKMLPDLAGLSSGKLLIISRAIPFEIRTQNIYNRELLPLQFNDFKKAMDFYTESTGRKNLTSEELKNIFEKTQGYPLGGQLIIRLMDFGDNLKTILEDIPKFEAERDEEGRKFSERLLDNIFRKGNTKEIKLLCEFSALFGFSTIDLIRTLPSFKGNHFDTLVNRRKFILNDGTGKFSSHAMIKDYAYGKLVDKELVHKHIGYYFEKTLKGKIQIDWDALEPIIMHYKKVGKRELIMFGQRMFNQFRNRDVKSLIDTSVNNTLRNYNFLIEVYPGYMPYYTELGMAYRADEQYDKAIITFLKAAEVSPKHLPTYNELGITYRETNQNQLAIATFKKAIEIDDKNLPSYNELAITLRVVGQIDSAIEYCEKASKISPQNFQSNLTLLQIYLFFKIDKAKAKYYFDLTYKPENKYIDVNQHLYRKHIRILNEIWNLEFQEATRYRNYINRAIYYKAYQTVIPLLFKLNEKFPNDSKIVSRLGKTLNNKEVGRYVEGFKYIKEAISLFESENNKEKYEDFVFFYLYGLLNIKDGETLKSEIENYKNKIKHLAKYYRFLGIYFQFLKHPESKIIETYKTAIQIGETNEEKLKAIEPLLVFMEIHDRDKYKTMIEEITKLQQELEK